MSTKSLSGMYREHKADVFPKNMEISFYDQEHRQTLVYEKVEWVVDDERRGLRYGENPDQEAALYRLVNGNLQLGEVECVKPGRYLASDMELLQSGKHPGKINVTDTDSALNILRYFQDRPAVVIIKHNNPCGVALGESVYDAYVRAFLADRVAAFGGVVALNRECDVETAEQIAASYCEVVVAPEYAPGVVDVFERRRNLRVVRIGNISRLHEFVGQRVVEARSLIDGGMAVQWSYAPQLLEPEALQPAQAWYKGTEYRIGRGPTPQEREDMVFGWLVESGVTSNSVLYVKSGATLAIGAGEQDRVGVAKIARDKAYRNMRERAAHERYGCSYDALDGDERAAWIASEVEHARGDLYGSTMVSDAFFPFRDGVEVGLHEGVTAVLQPGGSVRDFEVIGACNEYGATMCFTGQRSFRH